MLREESIKLTDKVLASALGDVYDMYTELVSSITAEPLRLVPSGSSTRKNPYHSLDISSIDQLEDLLKIMEHKRATL